MITVSNTTPLRSLIEIEKVHILETLFGHVFIPEKVAEELQRPKTPQKVRDWMQSLPAWLEVKQADLSISYMTCSLTGGCYPPVMDKKISVPLPQ